MHHVFPNCFEHLLKVVIRTFRVVKVHTHQFDALAVYHDRGGDGPFVDALNVNDYFSPPFVQHNSNTAFVIVFSSSHEDVFVMSPKITDNSCLHVSFKKIASHLYPSSSVTNSSIFHLSALTSCFFFEE